MVLHKFRKKFSLIFCIRSVYVISTNILIDIPPMEECNTYLLFHRDKSNFLQISSFTHLIKFSDR